VKIFPLHQLKFSGGKLHFDFTPISNPMAKLDFALKVPSLGISSWGEKKRRELVLQNLD